MNLDQDHSYKPSGDDKLSMPSAERMAALMVRASLLASDLRQAAHEAGIASAQFLTEIDLLVAANNGLSPTATYQLPEFLPRVSDFPREARAHLQIAGVRDDMHVMRGARDLLTFQHMINKLQHEGSLPRFVSQLEWAKKTFMLPPRTSHEFVDLLQQTARFFAEQSDRVCDAAAELYGIHVAVAFHQQQSVPFSRQPLITFVRDSSDELAVRLRPFTQPVPQSLAKGARILVVGGGNDNFSMLPRLKEWSDYRFVLSEPDPFIAKVYEYLIPLYGANNVSIAAGSLLTALRRRADLDLAVVSNLPSDKGAVMVDTITELVRSLKPGAMVHFARADTDDISYREWLEWEGLFELHRCEEAYFRQWTEPVLPLDLMKRDQQLGLRADDLELLDRYPVILETRFRRYKVYETPRR